MPEFDRIGGSLVEVTHLEMGYVSGYKEPLIPCLIAILCPELWCVFGYHWLLTLFKINIVRPSKNAIWETTFRLGFDLFQHRFAQFKGDLLILYWITRLLMKITRSQIAHVFQALLTNDVRKPGIMMNYEWDWYFYLDSTDLYGLNAGAYTISKCSM